MLTRQHHEWVADTFGVDVNQLDFPSVPLPASDHGGEVPTDPAPAPEQTPQAVPANPPAAPPSTPEAPAPGHTGMVNPDLPKRVAFQPPAQSRQPTLRKGDQSPDGWVEYLQELLKINVTGTFDDATFAAVKEFQHKNDCRVDGVVGNQTWSMLRNEKKEAVGTDKRAAHTFEQSGVQARWFREDKTVDYDKASDSITLKVESVGDQTDIAKFKATVRITPPGAKDGVAIEQTIGDDVEASPTGQGNRYLMKIAGLKANYPPEGDQKGSYKIEAYLEAALGGDRWTLQVKDPEAIPVAPIPPVAPVPPVAPPHPATPAPQEDPRVAIAWDISKCAKKIEERVIRLKRADLAHSELYNSPCWQSLIKACGDLETVETENNVLERLLKDGEPFTNLGDDSFWTILKQLSASTADAIRQMETDSDSMFSCFGEEIKNGNQLSGASGKLIAAFIDDQSELAGLGRTLEGLAARL